MSDVIRWTCEMVRSDIGGFVSNHDYQMAVEECDRLRAALSERDRMLGEAVGFLRSAYGFTTADTGLLPERIKAFLASYDASKKEKV